VLRLTWEKGYYFRREAKKKNENEKKVPEGKTGSEYIRRRVKKEAV